MSPAQNNTGEFLAGDWGTSSFRLSLIGSDGKTRRQIISERGVAQMPQDALLPYLQGELARLPEGKRKLPIILCGMAGSSIGLQEVPYLPCPADPQQLGAALTPLDNGGLNARIVPGLSARTKTGELEVMRGEETQIAGWLAQASEEERRSSWLCLPGTHAKWSKIESGRIQQFSTALTGELYAILSRHSVLVQGQQQFSDRAFEAGLSASDENTSLSFGLFSTRTRQLDRKLAAAESAAYLSALLIGSEVRAQLELWATDAAAKPPENSKVHLIGDRRITGLYSQALARHQIRSAQHDGAELATQGLWQLYLRSNAHD